MAGSGSRTTLLIGLGLVLLAAGLFWPAVGHDFLNLDDDRYVTRNPHLAKGLTAEGLAWAATTDRRRLGGI